MTHPERSCLICTLPRSGSWLISSALHRTGIAGHPREFFEPSEFGGLSGVAAKPRIAEMFAKGTTHNGVFTAKLHWHQFRFALRVMRSLSAEPSAAPPQLVAELFPEPKYVWLTRNDKVRQAVSYYRAIRTNVWWSTPVQPSAPSAPPEFSFAAIERLESLLTESDLGWQRYFDRYDIEPLVIHYESLKESLASHVRSVLDHLAVTPPSAPIDSLLRPQADETTELWVNRYRELKAAKTTKLAWFVKEVGAQPATAPAPMMNAIEMRVAAPQRSGHHAIINWLAAQAEGTVLHLNDAIPNQNPFFSASIVSRLDLPGAPQLAKNEVDLFTPRGLLLVSYEDRPLAQVFGAETQAKQRGWVGSTGVTHNVVVLRDVFNTFASRMRASWMRHKLTLDPGRAALVELWKDFAREALGQTRVLGGDLVFINYNRWFADRDYRIDLSGRLGLQFNDTGKNRVALRYGGSSFDGAEFRDRGADMQVLERWKQLAETPEYWRLFQDEELLELSDALFGQVGISEIYRQRIFAVASVQDNRPEAEALADATR